MTEAAQTRKNALLRAADAWNDAPLTIRAMGAQYVLPMLAAMRAMAEELDELQKAVAEKGGTHGGA